MIGATAAGDIAGTDESAPTPSSESAIGATDSGPIEESDAGTAEDRSTEPELTPAEPATPDTTELGRG